MDLIIKKAFPDEAGHIQLVYHDAYQENIKMGFPASAASVTQDEILNG